MARLRFYGGIGSIGSSKLAVEQDGWRALFDLGPLIPAREGLLSTPMRLREGRELATRLTLGEAPAIEHLYRPEGLVSVDLAGGADGRTMVFVSHCHIDHMGLLGWIDPAIPVHAAEETVQMVQALEACGQAFEGGSPQLVSLPAGQPVEVGPLVVERHFVDHDVPGASGYLIRCDAGLVAYTGDLRLHGRHPERSKRFAALAAGATALVIEGTTLSGDPRSSPPPEASVDRAYGEALQATPGLVLQSVYPRDVERVLSFLEIAGAHGRQILWPAVTAVFLAACGVNGIRTMDDAAIAEVRGAPSRFVVQVAIEALDCLLDLPLGPGSVFLHANGEPLGPFQPTWDLLQAWLARLYVPFRSIGTSGHATPGDLHRLVELVGPEVVYPIHTADPYRLLPPPGTRRVLPEYGRWYDIARGAPLRAERVAKTDPRTERTGMVLVDLDSTLADTSHRHHLVLAGEDRDRTDWVAYSMACADDVPIAGTHQLVRLLAADHRIAIVSSRDEKARQLTEQWLERHDVPYDELILGGVDGAPEGLDQFKIHHLRNLLERGEQVTLVVDDLPSLPESIAGAGLGVPVLTVRPPYA